MDIIIFALISIGLSVACYSVSQLLNHGKFKWSKKGFGFWDFDSDKRKYMSKIPFAKTFLVFLTDGYHLTQFFFLLFLSLGVGWAMQLDWLGCLYGWIGIHAVHFIVYRALQR
jgi:hypothetical protein